MIVVVSNVVNANPPKTVVPPFAIAAAVVCPTDCRSEKQRYRRRGRNGEKET
jgi:hypothetical protein